MNPQRVLIGGSLALVAACINPTDTCACTFPPAQAIVYGRVTNDGNAAPEAIVTVKALDVGCMNEPGNILAQAAGMTGADGSYRLPVSLAGPASARCVIVEATYGDPPTAISDPVSLAFRTRAPLDSVRVDLILGPGAPAVP